MPTRDQLNRQENALPLRLQKDKALTAEQRERRHHNFHDVNLLAKDLKPLIRERFRPVLKEHNFRSISELFFFRECEPHYVHYLQFRFSSVFPGRFHVVGGIAVDIVPLSNAEIFAAKRVSPDSDCLFVKHLTLPDGNAEFDNGANLKEAAGTIDYLTSSFKAFDKRYFKQFTVFPAPLDGLDLTFVQKLAALSYKNRESKYGRWGATEEYFAYRLALIHKFLGNLSVARELIEHGLAEYQLYRLEERYQRLLKQL